MTTARFHVPDAILTQHTAVLGKTGSGKTSTAKLLIEQVVADGARVCVLDPIKSDWWGLTSSADGKRAGLPFHILGGPRGHVPLHASAGKVVAEIVASGALPLSIIDMADFKPGGQAEFFTEFAPMLLRKMRGVVYLVIEEAHLFAPKERSGIGAENLSIHWAKTLATAGRSKGVRLILVTQRTQALHNALLGSCDTMLVHRLTAPADQEPVIKWLKSNVRDATIRDQVTNEMASLKTGTAWLCSGEAKIFKLVEFSRIATYDNTATPTGEGDVREVKTAPVDQEKLRTIIGDAVDKAKAEDPRELRLQIAALKKELAATRSLPTPKEKISVKRVEVPVLKDGQLRRAEGIVSALANEVTRHEAAVKDRLDLLRELTTELAGAIRQTHQPLAGRREEPTSRAVPAPAHRADMGGRARHPQPALDGAVDRYQADVLIALAKLHALGLDDAPKLNVAALARKSTRSSTWDSKLADLSKLGLVRYTGNGGVAATPEGLSAVPAQEQATGREIIEGYRAILSGYQNALLEPLLAARGEAMTRDEWAERANKSRTSSTFDSEASQMRAIGVIELEPGGRVKLASRLAEWL